MTFVGFNFTKISGEKTGNLTSNTKAKRDIKVTSISKEKLPIGDEGSTLRFDFLFSIKYVDLGSVLLEGFVLYMADPKEIEGILKNWEGKKHIEPKLMAQVLNNVLFKCHVKTLNITQDLNLPPHISLPYVSVDPASEGSKKEKS